MRTFVPFRRQFGEIATPELRFETTRLYVPALDGLRAIAILPVLLFHLNEAWFPSGFIGVDIFFVVSGFLITGLIARECSRGRFSFANFYQRRIARLFPVMILVLVTTTAAMLMLCDSREIGDNGLHLAASILSVANVFSAQEGGGYFGITKDVHPLLHFWSLSVEEQFYVFFPLTLVVLLKWSRKRLIVILGSLLCMSLIYCVVQTKVNQSWAYYMLPTRAWELLAGSLAAFALESTRERIGRLTSYFSWAGIACLLVAFVVAKPLHFPGIVASLPVAAAVLMILASGSQSSAVTRALSHPFLGSIGRLSYVLYLWHLSVFCLVDYRLLFTPQWERTTLKCVLTVGLTLVTAYYVEGPARIWFNRREHRREAFSFAAISLITLASFGVWERVYYYPEPKALMVPSGGLSFNDHGSRGSVALAGDSQACFTATTLRAIAVQRGFRFYSMCIHGSVPLKNGPGKAWQDTFTGVKRVKPDVLVIEMAWTGVEELTEAQLRTRLVDSVRELAPYTHSIVLVTQYPLLEPGMPRQALRDGLQLPFSETATRKTRREQCNAVVRSVAHDLHLSLVDTVPAFTLPDGSVRVVDGHGRPLYDDWMHASTVGVRTFQGDLDNVIVR